MPLSDEEQQWPGSRTTLSCPSSEPPMVRVLVDDAIEVSDADRARRQAERVARSKGSAVAFSRTGDPITGEFDDAVILGSFGEVADELERFMRS